MDDRRMTVALAFSSVFALGLLAGRVYYTGSRGFAFLAWNLLLAWVPYGIALTMPGITSRLAFLAVGAVWLVFFPNAPYLLTDVVHLRDTGRSYWFDLALVLAFAWTGCLLALTSLRLMHGLIERRLGRTAGWAATVGAVGLASIGIYLGRIHGWNSWDMLLSPRSVVADGLRPVVDPFADLEASVFIAVFAAFLLIAYLPFRAATSPAGASRAARPRSG